MRVKVIEQPAQVITTQEAKDHLRVTTDADDTLIAALVKAAQGIAQNFTQRPIGVQTLELALDEFPTDAVDLGPAVSSVTSVTYLDSDGASQTVSASDYVLDSYGDGAHWLVPAVDTSWPSSLSAANAVKVRFVAGEVTEEPIRAALLLLVGWLYENRGDSMEKDAGLPPAVLALLWPYRTGLGV